MAILAALDHGFRDHYLRYDELTAQVRAWAEAFPELVRVTTIGTTPEGRELWLLTLGPDPERDRPSVWIDGNMHAVELCGSSVALAIAEDVLRLHLGETPRALPAPMLERLRDVRFFVLPRMSPDGAELILGSGKYVRSTPRDTRPYQQHPHWVPQDLDGDGDVALMRVRDDAGDFVEDPAVPGLMVLRQLEDEGPFYKLYPEGVIANFDGDRIPEPGYLTDNHVDLNRNFPFQWAPENVQAGAGPFPASEPESRAVIEFTSAHPEIFAWMNLHTFGGVFIRPLGDKPDNKMNQFDLAVFRQIEAWAEEHTGYPMVSGFEEFTYEPDKPIYGDLTEYAYLQRGCIAYVVELWDLFEQIGAPAQKRFVDRYSHLRREDVLALARWDREENQGRIFQPWRSFEHPQLGAVEIGGIDVRVGIRNPPYEKIAEICAAQSECFLRVAAMAPAVRMSTEVEELGDGLHRVTATVENLGYLPTHVLASARDLDVSEPLTVSVETVGCELVDEADRRADIGHLAGWGTGRFGGTSAVFSMASAAGPGRRRHRFLVRGTGALRLRAGSCRVGWVEEEVAVAG